MEKKTAVIIRKLTQNERIEKQVDSWPIWQKEVSEFPWKYEQTEECYIIEGEIIVTSSEGEVTIMPDDFVVFPKGLSCRWNIVKPVKKYYNFPEM